MLTQLGLPATPTFPKLEKKMIKKSFSNIATEQRFLRLFDGFQATYTRTESREKEKCFL